VLYSPGGMGHPSTLYVCVYQCVHNDTLNLDSTLGAFNMSRNVSNIGFQDICSERKKVFNSPVGLQGSINTLCLCKDVCTCNSALSLDYALSALNMDSSTDRSKPNFDMQL